MLRGARRTPQNETVRPERVSGTTTFRLLDRVTPVDRRPAAVPHHRGSRHGHIHIPSPRRRCRPRARRRHCGRRPPGGAGRRYPAVHERRPHRVVPRGRGRRGHRLRPDRPAQHLRPRLPHRRLRRPLLRRRRRRHPDRRPGPAHRLRPTWRRTCCSRASACAAAIGETEALNYPKKRCHPTHVDGFRIYVPNATKSQYVAHPTTGCRNPHIRLISQKPYRRP